MTPEEVKNYAEKISQLTYSQWPKVNYKVFIEYLINFGDMRKGFQIDNFFACFITFRMKSLMKNNI